MSCKDVTGMTLHIDNKVSSQMLFKCFLSVSLDNHTMETHSAVSIRILDVNDNPPELALPYEASICEDAKPGQVSTFVSENETHKSCSWSMFAEEQVCCHVNVVLITVPSQTVDGNKDGSSGTK